jgi:hypothetical protein
MVTQLDLLLSHARQNGYVVVAKTNASHVWKWLAYRGPFGAGVTIAERETGELLWFMWTGQE